VPTVLDRAMGDVHPLGNPHIQTNPRNIARVAEVLAQRLARSTPPMPPGTGRAIRTLPAAGIRPFSAGKKRPLEECLSSPTTELGVSR
jgi:hypothetical protein